MWVLHATFHGFASSLPLRKGLSTVIQYWARFSDNSASRSSFYLTSLWSLIPSSLTCLLSGGGLLTWRWHLGLQCPFQGWKSPQNDPLHKERCCKDTASDFELGSFIIWIVTLVVVTSWTRQGPLKRLQLKSWFYFQHTYVAKSPADILVSRAFLSYCILSAFWMFFLTDILAAFNSWNTCLTYSDSTVGQLVAGA